MADNRIALQDGYEMDHDGKKFRIKKEVGRGASCIVYDAVYMDGIGIEHDIRIKECYPAYLLLTRAEDNCLTVFENEVAKYEEAKEFFVHSYRKNVSVRSTLGLTNSTVNYSDLFEKNNTVYIIMPLDEGIDFGKYEDQSLKELLEHIKSLSELIQKYHQNGYLHLDIKPENIFILPETVEHILLFDFDSAITFEELKQKDNFRFLYSEGFSAPEQVRARIDEMGRHTDIFSIGALLFFKLFGRKPDFEDCKLSSKYNFADMKFFNEKYQPKVYRLLEQFFKKTIAISIISRWQEMQPVIDMLKELIKLSDLEGVYLMDTFQYNAAYFVGREEEISEIAQKIQENQIMFLSGIGGIGKTEIARQYVRKYRDRYDTVVFSVFEESIERLVCDDIHINGIWRDENETDTEYFKRKINVLRAIITQKDLIIIDNFDVENDENIEVIFQCPCKFIITTREDFRDYNFQQIIIDRIKDQDKILQLFSVYNEIQYMDEETDAVKKLIGFVENHTMTVELLAKYLRNTEVSPVILYNDFLEREGMTNTEDVNIKQRKDRRLRSENVNDHLRILFDLSGFDDLEKEILKSLSLFAGIRIRKTKFQDICEISQIHSKMETLIRHGWIQTDEETDKIYLHQVVQDLIYLDLMPDAASCPNIVNGMIQYISEHSVSVMEQRLKGQVLDVFMSRLRGETISYARLCMLYGKEDKLMEAEKILTEKDNIEKFDILQRIYRKRIKIVMDEDIEADRIRWARIAELLEAAIKCCMAYTDSADYLSRELVEMGRETDYNLKWSGPDDMNEEIPELDRIYHLIIQAFDLAAENIPFSTYSAADQEKLYLQIQDFYLDNNEYRGKYFSDIEKVYQYQKKKDSMKAQTDGENCAVGIYGETKPEYFSWGISCDELADEYVKAGKYERAIELYEKVCEKEDAGSYIMAKWEISNIYLKEENVPKAIEALAQAWYVGKAIYAVKGNYDYPKNICCRLLQLLMERNEHEKAKRYSRELIYHCKQDLKKEDNNEHMSLTCLIAAYYCLYQISGNGIEKECNWNRCLEYYGMLGKDWIHRNICNFVEEYIAKSQLSYMEIINIADRIDTYRARDFAEKILLDAIEKYEKDQDFKYWHVLFLVKLAEISNAIDESSRRDTQKALEYCNRAQICYERNQLNDEYVQSLIYKIKAESMSGLECESDEEFEEVYEEQERIKKKCNYELITEKKISDSIYSDENLIDMWEEAANKYKDAENYDRVVSCLNKALSVMTPVLDRYDYSMFDNKYWLLMHELIQAYVEIKDVKNSINLIKKLYSGLIGHIESGKSPVYDENYRMVMKEIVMLREVSEENPWECIPGMIQYMYALELADGFSYDKNCCMKMNMIAEYLEQCGELELSLKKYMIALYLCVENVPDQSLIRDFYSSEEKMQQIYDRVGEIIDEGVAAEIVDVVVSMKEDIKRAAGKAGLSNGYKKIMNAVSEKYEYQDVEFKSNHLPKSNVEGAGFEQVGQMIQVMMDRVDQLLLM